MSGPAGKGPMLLTKAYRRRIRHQKSENRDLLRDPDFSGLGFIPVPASGSTRGEIPLPLDKILQQTEFLDGEAGNLKAGMRYRVWMKNDLLCVGGDSYLGDLAGELKDKKLSSYGRLGDDDDDYGEYLLGFAAEVLAGDGWALQLPLMPETRGNVGRFGPVIEFVD
ncbi:hypothetical protein C8R46DRAFT_1218799 [Mycena filopes]|nr:hypothetical protein C8R46DRAFT_1218799 [Mycena filopes]